MKSRFAAYATFIALSAATTVAAHAATPANPAKDQIENPITAQLNQQQLQMSGYGVETYQGIMQSPNQSSMREQIAQPPADSDLSIIE